MKNNLKEKYDAEMNVILDYTGVDVSDWVQCPIVPIIGLDLTNMERGILLALYFDENGTVTSLANRFYAKKNLGRVRKALNGLSKKGYITETKDSITVNESKILYDYEQTKN